MSRALGPLAFAFAGAWLLVAMPTRACGVCVEDKMAATYDHAVVERATARGQVIVYCEASAAVAPSMARQAAARVRGIEPASVRASSEPAALSFALDARGQSPQAAVQALQRRLGGGVRLTLLRTLGGRP